MGFWMWDFGIVFSAARYPQSHIPNSKSEISNLKSQIPNPLSHQP